MTTHGPQHRPPAYPTQSWYVAATSDEVTSSPLGRRALDTGLVLYRTSDGTAVVLEDRDAHSAYPLSLGRVEDDLIVSSYSGFAYAADGSCVRVPTQTEIPYDARVRCLPGPRAGRAGLGLVRRAGPRRTPQAAERALAGRRLVVDPGRRVDHRGQLHAAARELRRHHPRGGRRPVLRAAGAVRRTGPAARGGGHRDRRLVRAQLPAGPAGRVARRPAGRRARRGLRPARGGPVRLARSLDRQLGGRPGRRFRRRPSGSPTR